MNLTSIINWRVCR